jgi:hypothetical protein
MRQPLAQRLGLILQPETIRQPDGIVKALLGIAEAGGNAAQ